MKKYSDFESFTEWDFYDWAQNLFDWFEKKPIRILVLYVTAVIVAFLIIEPHKEEISFGKSPCVSCSCEAP